MILKSKQACPFCSGKIWECWDIADGKAIEAQPLGPSAIDIPTDGLIGPIYATDQCIECFAFCTAQYCKQTKQQEL